MALAAACVVWAVLAASCRAPEAPKPGTATPVYNRETGRLEQLVSDRDGDGSIDTRAYMDGTRVVRIEIDRDDDGAPDRFEYYGPTTATGDPVIERAEERQGTPPQVVRREFYQSGLVVRVEEDTDADGRVDKWEYYEGRLLSVDLDLVGTGKPNRRLHYGADGTVHRVESDTDGDGIFERVPAPSGPPPGQGRTK